MKDRQAYFDSIDKDQLMKDVKEVIADGAVLRLIAQYLHHADDLVILCRSKEEAEAALRLLADQLAARGLTLHPEKTRIVDAREPGGFDFLGRSSYKETSGNVGHYWRFDAISFSVCCLHA